MWKSGLQSRIVVENKEFSTFSTGFSTTVPNGRKSTKLPYVVNIKFALWRRGISNFLPFLHNAKWPTESCKIPP